MMRFAFICLILAVGLALGRDDAPPKAPGGLIDVDGMIAPGEAQQFAAKQYAQQILRAASAISDQYVRPVPLEKLVASAMEGLLQAAGDRAPAGFRKAAEKFMGEPGPYVASVRFRQLLRDPDFNCCLPIGLNFEWLRFTLEELDELAYLRMAAGDIDAIRGDRAVAVGLQRMISSLDPFSAYLTAGVAQRNERDDGTQAGLGIYLEDRRPGVMDLRVRNVVLDRPAQKAGIQPGDQVLEINGQPTEKMSVVEANERMTAELGTEIALSIGQDGKPPRKVKMAVELFREESVLGVGRREGGGWNFVLDRKHKIGYVRMTALNADAAETLREALNALQSYGMRGFVLDLRECPGGSLLEAVNTVKWFSQKRPIAKVRYRNPLRDNDTLFFGPSETSFLDFPMAILIGPDTSGGGELIAAALQDYKRAAIVGQRSRGKGSIQETKIPLGGGHLAKLTTGQFFRPSGKNLNRFPESTIWDDWGVKPDPDLEVRLSPELRRRIRQWRLQLDLRPPHSRQALPLDDPNVDPVLAMALAHLQKVMRPEKGSAEMEKARS